MRFLSLSICILKENEVICYTNGIIFINKQKISREKGLKSWKQIFPKSLCQLLLMKLIDFANEIISYLCFLTRESKMVL